MMESISSQPPFGLGEPTRVLPPVTVCFSLAEIRSPSTEQDPRMEARANGARAFDQGRASV